MSNLKKFFIIFLVLSILGICFNRNIFAVNNTTDEDTTSSNTAVSNETIDEDEEDNDDETNSSNENVVTDENVNTTSETSTNSTSSNSVESLAESQKINSYSTVSSLPEANLNLNNILNIILIALGILMVLLGIAILIRLKR